MRRYRVITAAVLAVLIFVPTGLGLARSEAPQTMINLGWTGLVRQSLDTSCGPAVIATLLHERGNFIDEAEVIAAADMTVSGVSLSEFADVAHHFGIAGRWFQVVGPVENVPVGTVLHLKS